MAKPFVKWAGGKGKLLHSLEDRLPDIFRGAGPITYIEPFVGGGAMLFHMLEQHPNIERAIINDINPQLINCYNHVKEHLDELLVELHQLEDEYFRNQSQDDRRAFYYAIRDEYNQGRNTPEGLLQITPANLAAYFIFLNRTCFNGLYRENHQGSYNVPFGRYANPVICNEDVLRQAHEALQRVTILCGNYQDVMQHVNPDETNFFYFDPPYRPLLGSNNFKDYTQFEFGDNEQEELCAFCRQVDAQHGLFMLSNSDSEIEPGVNYFEQLYEGFHFDRVQAPRVINAFAAGRVPQSEVVIRNYQTNQD